MIIKSFALVSHLSKKIAALYILTGLDHYLINEASTNIKNAWRLKGVTDEKTLYIHAPADWDLLLEEANSYSLFAEYVLLDVRFDKKSMDSYGKKILQAYLEKNNPRCLILLNAPHVPQKQWQFFVNLQQVIQVQAFPLNDKALQSWIGTTLQQKGLRFETSVPLLIQQYTQNNMLATAQVIEKLMLSHENDTLITTSNVLEHLVLQCDYSLYELADACLLADANKTILLLRQVSNNRGEPTLILWLLSQEVRLLIQLTHLLNQSTFSNACNQLKIWPQRTYLYDMAQKRLSLRTLHSLLIKCQQIDEAIKSSQNTHIWHELERLALSFCFPRSVTCQNTGS